MFHINVLNGFGKCARNDAGTETSDAQQPTYFVAMPKAIILDSNKQAECPWEMGIC